MSDETQSYREHLRITGETAPTVISDESEEIEQLRARVAELEEQVKEAVVRLARVPYMLDRERREGAEAMRERTATWLRGLLGSVIGEAIVARAAALPLDDDAREDAQGQEVNER